MKRPFGKQLKYLLPNVSIVLCSWDSSTQENVNLKDKIKDNVKNIKIDYTLRFLEDCIMDERFEMLVIFHK
jgi:hypothetical protein